MVFTLSRILTGARPEKAHHCLTTYEQKMRLMLR